MKKKLIMACLIGFISFFASSSNAQISVDFNVGAQPLWGPVGYDQANYYYLPDIQTYYSVPTRQYVYLENNKWTFNNSLPSRYSGYNLYNGYKVVLNNPRPYLSFDTHKVKYAKYKGYKGKQPAIRYSNNSKYFVVKGHPKHSMAPGQARKTTVSRINNVNGARNSNDNHQSKGNDKDHSKGNGHEKGNGKGKH